MIIESRANERVKEARKLLLRKERKESGLHLIESEKLVREAVSSGAKIVSCFIEDGFAFTPPEGAIIYSVSRAVLESLVGTDDMLDIQVFEGAPHFKDLHKGMKGKVLCVSGIAFTMAGDLSGPWTCGVLRSRGWGSIRKAV